MAIASLAFLALLVIPLVASFQTQRTTATPSPTATGSAQEELEQQARGYELVLQREPNNQTALRGLVEVRIQQDNVEGTIEPLEQLAELNPNQPDYLVLLAQVKERTGDLEGAAQAYRDILSFNPGQVNALQGLSDLLITEGRPEAAIALLQDTLQSADESNQVQPGSVDVSSVQLLLGQIYAEQKRYDEAIEVYDRTIDANPDDFRPILAKAIVLQAQGKTAEAEPLFTRAETLSPPEFRDKIKQMATGQSPNPVTPIDPANPAAPPTPGTTDGVTPAPLETQPAPIPSP